MNFIIIGYGRIGRRHAEVVQHYPKAQLVALVDPLFAEAPEENNPKQEADIPTPTADKEVLRFASWEAFAASETKAQVAIIASPNGLHCRQAIAALQAGMHVVIEKPMGLNRAECEAVVHASLQVSRQVFVVKQNRYSPPAKWLKEVVSQNALGQIYLTQVNCFWNRDERYYLPQSWKGTTKHDGGVLFTQFSHFVDIMYWVFGDIKNIQTRLENFKHRDTTEFADSGLAQFEWVQGGMGTLQFSTAVWQRNMESSLTVIGEKGSLKIGGQYMNEVQYCNIEGYAMPHLPKGAPPNKYEGYQGSAGNHYQVIDNVMKTLRSEATITANAMEGMKVVDMIERIYKAAI